MNVKFSVTLNLDPYLAEAISIDEDSTFETYYEDGKIIVQRIDEDDFYAQEDSECINCPYFCPICGECNFDE